MNNGRHDGQDTFLTGSNIQFIEALYARYLENPAAVDPSWRDLFSRSGGPGRPIVGEGLPFTLIAPAMRPVPGAPVPGETAQMRLQARVDRAVYAFRLRGHLLAQLDPLGRQRPPLEDASDLDMVDPRQFTAQELERQVGSCEVFEAKTVRLADLLERLRETYCHHVGVELMHILDSGRRRWLMRRMELSGNRTEPSPERQLRLLTKLSYAEAFESVLNTKFMGHKRFSLDGAESLVPMIDALLEVAGESAVSEVVIGMAHRGRLNVLTNILRKTPSEIFSEFQGPADPRAYLGRGDVKYHLGFSYDHVTSTGAKIHLSLAFNPSHLEAVNPVVEGRVRAKQDRKRDPARTVAIPLLVHGDAAFAGQGVVAETLNLSGLPGYTTGGTVHVVVNNQLGFTTTPEEGRTARYCTAMALMLDVPIFHVNADDPEACVHVMQLATEYRQQFKSDVVIDLVCYRRYGHNEADEPAFTQPVMYELIRAHPRVRQLYGEDLARRGRLSLEKAEAVLQGCHREFEDAYNQAKKASALKEPSFLEGLWKSYKGGSNDGHPEERTGVPRERLDGLLQKLAETPEGFHLNPKIKRVIVDVRRAMAAGKEPIDWSAGETLAYASLLVEGHPVRLTGQDTERGTFSHRHAVFHDIQTGARHVPLEHLAPDQAPFWVYNSPLSEMGPLGFEYGFSLDYPDALVLWEAQFGDFANMAQAIIDQFIVASEDKWRRLSGITLLLPHGYEGQGPEHSSARLERFLDLCGDENIQIACPTTAAQLFHLLRRQVVRTIRKPLVVMTPKSFLRRDEVKSTLDELATGQFMRVIPDEKAIAPGGVEKLILCTGKIFFDLSEARQKRPDSTVGLLRVEQLYPFPREEVKALLEGMPKLETVLWVQEEPQNMGAWRYMLPVLEEMVEGLGKKAPEIGFVGRAESATPATGVREAHILEQEMIVEEALSRGGPRAR